MGDTYTSKTSSALELIKGLCSTIPPYILTDSQRGKRQTQEKSTAST